MSRSLIVGVLLILIMLVGVMAGIVNKPYQKEEPKQEQKLTPAQEKEKTEQAKKQEIARRKMAELETQHMAGAPKLTTGGKPAAHPGKAPGAMDLDSGWWKRRADGEAGVAALKAKDAEEKKEQAHAIPSPVKSMPRPMPTTASPN